MKIVVVSGGFDPIHSGHISYLNEAKKIGDKLIVALNSDEWLTIKKGKNFMAISAENIKSLLKKKFPEADIEIIDTAGDSNHYSAKITAQEFRGKSRVEQHKLVYKALEGAMDGNNGILHALALQTKIK